MAFPAALLTCIVAHSQPVVDSTYQAAFGELTTMLNGDTPYDLRHAVFAVENAYFDDSLGEEGFDNAIEVYARLARAWIHSNRLIGNTAPDSLEFAANAAVFQMMTDTTFIAPGVPLSLPFVYDTVDYFGLHDWTKMLVTKLLVTHSGNCHSMPLLYKMVCERIGGRAWLALAPDHLYLKQHSDRLGWYNTELTSAAFPSDAWIMASGYVSADAVRSGIYMDTLGTQATLALCVVDLVQGYMSKARIVDEQFVIACCNRALRAQPDCVSALLVKAEALRRALQDEAALNDPDLNNTLATLVHLGYREIPLEVYLQWMRELAEHRETFRTPNATPAATNSIAP